MGRTKEQSTIKKNQFNRDLLYKIKEDLLKVTMIIFKRNKIKRDGKQQKSN